MKTLLTTLTASAVFATAAGTAHAAPVFYDGFELGAGTAQYEAGTLIGQPGTGGNWTGDARLAGSGIQVPGSTGSHGYFPDSDPSQFGVQTGGLSYSGIQSAGGHISTGTYLTSVAGASGERFAGRNPTGLSTAQQGTGDYYFSLITQAPDAALPTGDRIMAGFTNSATSAGFYAGYEGDKIGVYGRGFGNVSSNYFFQSLGTFTADEAYLIVLKYESSNANRTVTVWLNPVISGGSVTSSMASWTGVSAMTSGSTTIDGIDIYAKTTTTDTAQLNVASFDEFRIGTDLASVVPIPEPASLALLGLGSLLMLGRGRREA